MKPLSQVMLVAALCAVAPSNAANNCEVVSGPKTAAVIELYSSEGCSSCPPADLALRNLASRLDAGAVVVPLALHVTYWDRIGWQDIFAQKMFDTRQTDLLQLRPHKTAYTPQFFVNGDELRDWNAALPAAIRRINARPAPLTIRLKSTQLAAPATEPAGMRLMLDAEVNATDTSIPRQLYFAVSESGLVSHVLRGENGGATLEHDHVVRQLLGPFAINRGKARIQREITLPAAWRDTRTQVAAFVQDTDDRRIAQAVSTAQCTAPGPRNTAW